MGAHGWAPAVVRGGDGGYTCGVGWVVCVSVCVCLGEGWYTKAIPQLTDSGIEWSNNPPPHAPACGAAGRPRRGPRVCAGRAPSQA